MQAAPFRQRNTEENHAQGKQADGFHRGARHDLNPVRVCLQPSSLKSIGAGQGPASRAGVEKVQHGRAHCARAAPVSYVARMLQSRFSTAMAC